MDNEPNNDKYAIKVSRHVTWVGFWCNIALGVAKIFAGIIGRSGAVIADGVHSLSDFFTDVVILVMFGISRKGVNQRYQYGHGKYETFATMIISVSLLFVSVLLFWDALQKIIDTINGMTIEKPGYIALIMCALSILTKEWLYRYTRAAGIRINSAALIANAWHHRSDSFSSIATLAGVSGAMFLGDHWRILDPIAAMFVAILIAIVSIKLALPSIRELLEVSLPEEVVTAIKTEVRETPGVKTFHHLRSRRSGNTIIIDIDIKVAPDITVVAAHEIATQVEKRISTRMGGQYTPIVTTHIEPYKGAPRLPDGSCK